MFNVIMIMAIVNIIATTTLTISTRRDAVTSSVCTNTNHKVWLCTLRY